MEELVFLHNGEDFGLCKLPILEEFAKYVQSFSAFVVIEVGTEPEAGWLYAGMAMMHKIYPQHLSILRCDFSQKHLPIRWFYAIL